MLTLRDDNGISYEVVLVREAQCVGCFLVWNWIFYTLRQPFHLIVGDEMSEVNHGLLSMCLYPLEG